MVSCVSIRCSNVVIRLAVIFVRYEQALPLVRQAYLENEMLLKQDNGTESALLKAVSPDFLSKLQRNCLLVTTCLLVS